MVMPPETHAPAATNYRGENNVGKQNRDIQIYEETLLI